MVDIFHHPHAGHLPGFLWAVIIFSMVTVTPDDISKNIGETRTGQRETIAERKDMIRMYIYFDHQDARIRKWL